MQLYAVNFIPLLGSLYVFRVFDCTQLHLLVISQNRIENLPPVTAVLLFLALFQHFSLLKNPILVSLRLLSKIAGQQTSRSTLHNTFSENGSMNCHTCVKVPSSLRTLFTVSHAYWMKITSRNDALLLVGPCYVSHVNFLPHNISVILNLKSNQ